MDGGVIFQAIVIGGVVLLNDIGLCFIESGVGLGVIYVSLMSEVII